MMMLGAILESRQNNKNVFSCVMCCLINKAMILACLVVLPVLFPLLGTGLNGIDIFTIHTHTHTLMFVIRLA